MAFAVTTWQAVTASHAVRSIARAPALVAFGFFTGGATRSSWRSTRVKTPKTIQLIGKEVAIVWDDGAESYFTGPELRAASPSAETRGEKDIFGKQYGGTGGGDFSNVEVLGFERVGNYALRFDFSDGHRTGLYGYDLLLELAGRHR